MANWKATAVFVTILCIVVRLHVNGAGPIQSSSSTGCVLVYPYSTAATGPATGKKITYVNGLLLAVDDCQRVCADGLHLLDKKGCKAGCKGMPCGFAVFKASKDCLLYATDAAAAIPAAEKAALGDTIIESAKKCPSPLPAGAVVKPITQPPRCATPKPGPSNLKGTPIEKGKGIPYQNVAFNTLESCQKMCADNLHQLDTDANCPVTKCKAKACVLAVFQAKTKQCFLYTDPQKKAITNPKKIIAEDMIITIEEIVCPATTMAPATTISATTNASQAVTTATTNSSQAVTTNSSSSNAGTNSTDASGSATTTKAAENCCSWAQRGECDANPFYMKLNCRVECGTPTATLENAHLIPSNNIASCKSTLSSACKDENIDCAKWALNNQCLINPFGMYVTCTTSCKKCVNGTRPTIKNACGDTDDPPIQGCANNDQRCNYWALTGECTNNPSWMANGCCAACRNILLLKTNCPLVR